MIIIMLIASNVVHLAYIAFGTHHKTNSNALIVIPLNIYRALLAQIALVVAKPAH